MADDPTSSPSFWGGLMQGLQNAPENPLFNIGLGLMSAAKPFGNVGDSLMQANQQTLKNQAAKQNLAINSYALQKQREMMPLYQQAMQAAIARMGGQNSQQINQQPSMQQPSSIPPMISLPQNQQPQQVQQPPNRYDPLPPLRPMGGDPAGDLATGQALAFVPGMKDAADSLQNSPKNALAAQEFTMKTRQQTIAPQLADLDSIMTSSDADKRLQQDKDLYPLWQQSNNGQPLTAPNARAFAGTIYNRLAGSAGAGVKPIPTMLQNAGLGQGETGQFDPITGKKVGDLTERQNPTFTLTDVWDPNTNTTKKIPVQTGGYGMQGVGPTGNVVSNSNISASPGARYPASASSLGFNTGFKPPTDPETKAAMFAGEYRSGLTTIRNLENTKGFTLNPAQRTAFINAATSEEPGAIKQFLSQEYLSKMSPEAQTYISALMPMLQAAGHDQSGARLSTSQVRQNIESLVPPSGDLKPQTLAQINKSRDGFYTGLLTQAGSATQLPQYKDTLGSDLKGAQGTSSTTAEGATSTAKSGRPIVFKNGHWQYK